MRGMSLAVFQVAYRHLLCGIAKSRRSLYTSQEKGLFWEIRSLRNWDKVLILLKVNHTLHLQLAHITYLCRYWLGMMFCLFWRYPCFRFWSAFPRQPWYLFFNWLYWPYSQTPCLDILSTMLAHQSCTVSPCLDHFPRGFSVSRNGIPWSFVFRRLISI